jgi:hypothetical protein
MLGCHNGDLVYTGGSTQHRYDMTEHVRDEIDPALLRQAI